MPVIEKLAHYVYVFFGFLVLMAVLVYKSIKNVADQLDNSKDVIRTYVLPDPVLLLIGLALAFLLMFVLHHNRKQFVVLQKKATLYILTAVFLIAKIWLSLELLFKTGWDAGWMFTVAKCLINGEAQSPPYLSMFPFNFITVEYMRLCIQVGRLLNPQAIEPGLVTVVILNCVQVAIGSLLVFDMVKHILNSRRMAWVAWFLYVVFLGLSPWVCIPYTDSMAFVIPTLVLWLYMKLEDSKHPVALWTLIAFCAYWGYRIKGVALLVFLAILLTQLLHMMREQKVQVKQLVGALAGMTVAILLTSKVLIPGIIEHSGIPYNPEHTIGAEYLICVGLNPWTHGTFDTIDYDNALNTPDREERNEILFATIRERLEDYGPVGLLKHQLVKTVIIFNDGTFAWSQEGNFYEQVFPEWDWFTPRLRNIFYEDGEHYNVYSSFMHMMWLTMFVLGMAAVVYKPQKKYGNVLLALIMSLAAMFVFAELVEARARYLYTFAPLYLIAGVIGSYVIYQRIRSRAK